LSVAGFLRSLSDFQEGRVLFQDSNDDPIDVLLEPQAELSLLAKLLHQLK
jgi:hypothetical protein